MVNYTDNIIPKMTSNNTDGFIAAASSVYSTNYPAWGAFDRGDNYWSASSGASNGWISCEFPTSRKIVKFTIKSRTVASSPKIFSFDGFDGSNWIVLFKEDNAPNWKDGEKREYFINNTNEYNRYRVNVSQSQSAGRYPEISEIEMMEELIHKKTLLQSNNKTYSLESNDAWYETKMTSNNAPSPFIASASSVHSSGTFPAWKAFNGTDIGTQDVWISANSVLKAWIQIDYGKTMNVNKLALISSNYASYSESSPRSFDILYSNDGINFNKSLSVKNQSNWSTSETREFHFKEVEARYFRIDISESNNSTFIAIGEISFGYKNTNLIQVPSISIKNLVKYGVNKLDKLDTTLSNKNYILQDTISENSDGLWTTQLDRKPLSIKFE
ncbi:discoidin domain-containing protein [Lysinibacillus sp. NPDC048646]|uniref:discoidin domain-containing protein n=1 Tax=Lysinibacillus sp. NPDC048646 TaxID=3390574 RepID=UPI003D00A9C9